MGHIFRCGSCRPKKNEDAPTYVFFKHFLAGGLAGGLSRTTTAPFDRMKVYYQVNKRTFRMKQVFNALVEEGGYLSLWRGNLVNVCKTVPKSALRFGVYDKTKKLLHASRTDSSQLYKIIAGSVAGVVTQTLTYPLDVLKIRMSLRKTGQYNGIFDAIIKILESEGVSGFYRGFWTNILTIIPYSGLDLAGYEFCKREYRKFQGRDLFNYELFIVSGFSSIFSQTTTYPLYVILTRLQASTKKLRGVTVLIDIYKHEGLYGYFKGLTPNLMKFVPAMAITYFTYENVIYLMGASMSSEEK